MIGTAPMTSAELLARLQRHYINPAEALPGGIFVPEVGINGATGRRCDGIYVGFTSASGRRLVGHEIKVSRSDWQHELDTVGKADFWHDNTHQWYVVAPSTDIVDPASLPHGWGLLVPSTRSENRMAAVVKAADRAVTPSWDAVRSIMSRQDTLRDAAIRRAQDKARDSARTEWEEVVRDLKLAQQSGGRPSPHVQHMSALVDAINRRRREADLWLDAADEEIIAAAVDLGAAHRLADQIRHEVRRAVAQANRLVQPIKLVEPQLQKVLDDLAQQTLDGALVDLAEMPA